MVNENEQLKFIFLREEYNCQTLDHTVFKPNDNVTMCQVEKNDFKNYIKNLTHESSKITIGYDSIELEFLTIIHKRK